MVKRESIYIDCGAYDIEICVGVDALKQTIRIINDCGWTIAGITQNEEIYTLLIWRSAG